MDEQLRGIVSLVPLFRQKQLVIEPLEGGLTNRNYRIQAGDDVFVLRIGGADANLLGIDRKRELACARAAAAAGIGPEVIAYHPEHQAMVRRFVPGRLLTAE